MARVVKVFGTLRNHWKKSTVAACALSYGGHWLYGKHCDNLLRKEACLVAREYGRQQISPQEQLRKATVILNPAACSGKANTLFEKNAAPILHLAGVEVTLVKTDYEGQAKKLMELMEQTDMLIVAGGDGTLQEVITGLLRRADQESFSKTPIGFIPLGSHNSLSESLHILSDNQVKHITSATLSILQGETVPLDVLQIKGEKDQPVFALIGLRWGAFRDVAATIKKYWYLGPLKTKAAHWFSTLREWPQVREASVSYLAPTLRPPDLPEQKPQRPHLMYRSVCRMSSKEKMNVQDQSKERRSEGLELSEEKESSPEGSTLSSPDTESATSTVSPAEKQTPEEKDVEERDQDRASRTARVQPTPQRKDPLADSPNNTNPDRRKFQAPVRDEESESQRKARSRLMRQSRRSTQGVTLTDLKEAEKSVAKPADPPPSNILHVSPIVTITPAERDTDPVKEVGSEGETRLGVRDRRKGRRERRSTGVVQLGNEHLDAMDEAQQDENHRHSSPSEPQLGDSSPEYKMLYMSVLQENSLLRDKLQETALLLSQSKVELERLRQSQESNTERPALLELERFEKRALQRKAVELEDELKVLVDLRADNQRLKDENAALIRVISKLSK